MSDVWDDPPHRCRRGHFMKGTDYVTQGGDLATEWRCDYCRRQASNHTDGSTT